MENAYIIDNMTGMLGKITNIIDDNNLIAEFDGQEKVINVNDIGKKYILDENSAGLQGIKLSRKAAEDSKIDEAKVEALFNQLKEYMSAIGAKIKKEDVERMHEIFNSKSTTLEYKPGMSLDELASTVLPALKEILYVYSMEFIEQAYPDRSNSDIVKNHLLTNIDKLVDDSNVASYIEQVTSSVKQKITEQERKQIHKESPEIERKRKARDFAHFDGPNLFETLIKGLENNSLEVIDVMHRFNNEIAPNLKELFATDLVVSPLSIEELSKKGDTKKNLILVLNAYKQRIQKLYDKYDKQLAHYKPKAKIRRLPPFITPGRIQRICMSAVLHDLVENSIYNKMKNMYPSTAELYDVGMHKRMSDEYMIMLTERGDISNIDVAERLQLPVKSMIIDMKDIVASKVKDPEIISTVNMLINELEEDPNRSSIIGDMHRALEKNDKDEYKGVKRRLSSIYKKYLGKYTLMLDVAEDMIENAKQKNALIDKLITDKELKSAFEQVSNIVGFVFPPGVRILNDMFLNSDSLASMFHKLYSFMASMDGYLSSDRKTKVYETREDEMKGATIPTQSVLSTYYLDEYDKQSLSDFWQTRRKEFGPSEEEPYAKGVLFNELKIQLINTLAEGNFEAAKDIVNEVKKFKDDEVYMQKLKELEELHKVTPLPEPQPILTAEEQAELQKAIKEKNDELAANILKNSRIKQLAKHFENKLQDFAKLVFPFGVSLSQKSSVEYHSNIGESHMIDIDLLKEGQPVIYNDNVFVIVSTPSDDPYSRYLIKDTDINSHTRVDLIKANIKELTPVKIFQISDGDIIDINGVPMKVVDSSSKELGFVWVQAHNSMEIVPFKLEGSDIKFTYKPAYNIKRCANDGGIITVDDAINCPHDAPVPEYKEPVNEEKIPSAEEIKQAALKQAEQLLERLSFEEVNDKIELPEAPVINEDNIDYDSTLEIGAKVKRIAGILNGTIIGKDRNLWIVNWENGKTGKYWGQELQNIL